MVLGIASLHISCPLQAQTIDSGKWRTFENSPGRYKASFPGAPVMKRGKLRTEIGEIVSVRHTADSADATYDVTYNDYPKDGIARLSATKLLDTVRDGLLHQSKGTLASEIPFTLGKLAGREYEIAVEDGMRYRIRLLLVESRLYQLTAMARLPARPEEKRFFSSFQLTGVTPP